MSDQQPWPQDERRQAAKLAAQVAERRQAMQRLTLVGLVFLVILLGIAVVTYFQYEYWQVWVDAGGVLLAIVCLSVARWLIGRDRLDAAGYTILAAAMLAWAGGELVWAGETGYNLVGGLLLIVVAGMIALPRRWWSWLAAGALYTLYVAVINRLQPLPRIDVISSSLEMRIAWIFFIAVLSVVFLWQVVRAYMRIGTIRIRLLVAFVALVILVVLVLGVGLAVGGLSGVQQQVMNQLESVSILKEAEIETWIDDLHADLGLALLGDEVMDRVFRLLAAGGQGVEDTAANDPVRARLSGVIERGGRYEEIFVLDRNGRVVLSTDVAQEGTVQGSQIYFREGLAGPYVQSPRYSSTDMRTVVFAARPIKDGDGDVVGVLAGRASMARLNAIMAERAGLGETGETYLVGSNQVFVTPTRLGELNVYAQPSEGIVQSVQEKQQGVSQYTNHRGEAVVGAYRWLPELNAALLAEQSQAEAFTPVYTLVGIAAGVGLLAVLIAVGFSLLLTRSIATPLAALAETATEIAAGDLAREATVAQEDEIGTLAWAFNSMTAQLRELISSLEDRVADRTQELEQRSLYLEAAAEVGRAASSILQAEYLMEQVVSLIREEFGLYYVGLFLVDETGEWAVLEAGTGEGESVPLVQQYRVRVRDDSMVGVCIVHGEAQVAQDGGADRDSATMRLAFLEPLDTGSEAALPLHSRGQVIGALVVQDIQSNAFDQDAIVVLQTMADQVAVALDNAQLFAERQDALEMAQRAYGELSREAWTEILQARPHLGFRSSERGITPVAGDWPTESELALELGHTVMGDDQDGSGQYVLSVPLHVRGQVIGVLDTYKPVEAGEWTPEEVALLERIAEELDPALEGARLYQDTQRRAAREQTLRQVTERMRQAVDVEVVLQNTVIELAKALGAPRAYVRLGTEEHLRTAGHDRAAGEASGMASEANKMGRRDTGEGDSLEGRVADA
jgi:GAF domain-containing protein/HAMP domain-containing protein